MYTVSKGPSKIVHKTRRGITQNLDRLENSRDFSKKWIDNQSEPSPDDWTIRVEKPVFHSKKANSTRSQQEAISPQHEEMVKFIYESWNSVCKECEEDNGEQSPCDEENGDTEHSSTTSSSIVYYKDSEPNLQLQDFKPFDLESWWGKRLFNTITKSIP